MILALAALLAAPVFADPPAATAKPVIVYVETDPWLMVIGSDSPQFALYEDGTVIFRTPGGYRWAALADAERAALEAGINLDGIEIYSDYAPEVTDQPTSMIFDFRGPTRLAVAYGAVSSDRKSATADDPLMKIITLLRDYGRANSQPWEPEFVEVMIWSYDHAPEASIIWPKKWPGLEHPNTVQRGDSFSLFVPSEQKQELLDFLGTQRQRGAVEIGGRKWAVSLRVPFPGEALWMISEPAEADQAEVP